MRAIPYELLLSVAMLATACGGALPNELPASSAASLEARATRPRPVTRALDGDPPLPGEDDGGWAGLSMGGDEEAGAAHPHHHHHGPTP